ncbi:MAG: preprotein translocase subunit SecY [Clostridia bacterium]|nr:preprotein translocase subunit SecY [Clostridia bacterium]
MLQTLRNAWKIPDLRKKILYTILLLIVFRFGSVIPVPWINRDTLQAWLEGANGSTIFDLLDTFSGGAFSSATIFAMSISPYINSSIIMQLLCVAIPTFERWSKEGEEGREKITKVTRYLTVVLAAVQAYGLYVTLHNQGAIMPVAGVPSFVVALTIILAFVAGTAFLMWLGEQITGRGIGNGISMLIFAGIVSRVPVMIQTAWNNFVPKRWYILILLAVYSLASILFVVLVNEAERRIPVQYAKRVVGRKMYGGQSSNIPIKVAMGGVIPIIFAMSIMSFPGTLAQLFGKSDGILVKITNFVTSGPIYPILYFLLIVGFTYFYTSITFNPVEVSNNIKKNNGMVPGIRPGRPTTEYIAKVLSRITLIGSFFLGFIAVLPIVLTQLFTQNISALSLTGTSLLIVVGVALETVKEIESQMIMRHYKGFLE